MLRLVGVDLEWGNLRLSVLRLLHLNFLSLLPQPLSLSLMLERVRSVGDRYVLLALQSVDLMSSRTGLETKRHARDSKSGEDGSRCSKKATCPSPSVADSSGGG